MAAVPIAGGCLATASCHREAAPFLFHPQYGIGFERQVMVNKNLILCFHTIRHVLQYFRNITLDEGGGHQMYAHSPFQKGYSHQRTPTQFRDGYPSHWILGVRRLDAALRRLKLYKSNNLSCIDNLNTKKKSGVRFRVQALACETVPAQYSSY
jgi:hypothetical protein